MEAFADDKLNRKQEAIEVSNYLINRYTIKQDAFVLNLDADWGFGKTYFLQNWKKYLESERKCKVIYFNAWKHDFSQDPLISFMASVESQLSEYIGLNSETQSFWRKMRDEALPLFAGIISKKALGASISEIKELLADDTEQPDDVEENEKAEKSESEIAKVTSALSAKATKLALAEQKKIENQINNFTENLEKLAKEINGKGIPLFIFVDELDRCRPNFAIQLLEVIKHLFSAKGVYFVIATASNQLSEAVKAVYGQGFDGAKYLNRFFDQTYHFVKPDISGFASLLFSQTPEVFDKFDSFIIDVPRNKNGEGIIVCEIANWLNTGLRDIQQAYSIMECIALTKRNERFVVLPLALFCLAKIAQPEIYLKLKNTFRYNANIASLEYDSIYKDLKNYNARNRQMEFPKQDILQQCFEVLQYSSGGNLKEPGNSSKTISKLFYNKNSVEQLNYFPVHKYFELIESAVRFKSNA